MNQTNWPRLLLVEDESRIVRCVVRALAHFGKVEAASTYAEALVLIGDASRFSAVILDVGLPDGSGLDLLEAVRVQVPAMPALLLTAHDDHDTICRAQLLGAEYLLKPWQTENLEAFVERALAFAPPQRRMASAVGAMAKQYKLSRRETELVQLAVGGTDPAELPQRMGVTANTLKTLTRRVLYKTGARRLGEVVRTLQRRILLDANR